MRKLLALVSCLVIGMMIFSSCGKPAQAPSSAGTALPAGAGGSPEPLTLPITKEPVP